MPRPDAEAWRKRYRQTGNGVFYRWFSWLRSTSENSATSEYSRGEETTRYIENVVATESRILAYAAVEMLNDYEFGILPRGSLKTSVFTDEAPMRRGDRVILPSHRAFEDGVITRGATNLDPVPLFPVLNIERVWAGSTTYVKGVDYQQSGNYVEWIGSNKPALNATYGIHYSRQPMYTFLADEAKLPWADINGILMPMDAMLKLESDMDGMEAFR